MCCHSLRFVRNVWTDTYPWPVPRSPAMRADSSREYRGRGALIFVFSFLSLLLNWSFCQLSFLRFARPRKRLAARSFARARRAVGGFACEHASALGHASAMRCIAANRHGSPLCGTRNFTEKPHVCLRPGLKAPLRPFSVGFCVGRSPFPCPLAAAAMQCIARAGGWRWPCLHGPARSPARRPPTAARRDSGFRGRAQAPPAHRAVGPLRVKSPSSLSA